MELSHAVLYEPNFLPGKNGDAVNLKGTLNTTGVEGKSMGLKLTLEGNFVKVETKNGTGLIPVMAFKMLIPKTDA